jgi:hypothetical protein
MVHFSHARSRSAAFGGAGAPLSMAALGHMFINLANANRCTIFKTHSIYIMKYFFIFILALSMVFTACRRKVAKEVVDIYPISAILQENAGKVDSAFKTFTYYKTQGVFKDSLVVNNAFFNDFAKQFYAVDLTADKFKTYYSEASFQDESNGAAGTATFTYNAINDKAPFGMMQIAINRKTEGYTYAFLTKTEKSGDTTISKKLSWFFNRNAMVTSTHILSGKVVKDIIERVVWNKN